MQLRTIAQQRPLVVFFGLTYALTWLLWLPLVLSRTGLGWLPVTLPMPYVLPGTFGPTLAAFLTQWLARGRLRFFSWAFAWKSILGALLLGFGLLVFAFLVVPSALLTTSSWDHWQWQALRLYPATIGHSILFAAGPLGEEPGWRGFALPRLRQRYGWATASGVLGLFWVGWHLPLFLLPAWSSSSLLGYAGIVLGLSTIMALAGARSENNILVAIVLHGTFNASPPVVSAFLATSKLRATPPFELALTASFVAVGLSVWCWLRHLDHERLAAP